MVGTGIYWTYVVGTWRKNGQLVSRIDRRWGVWAGKGRKDKRLLAKKIRKGVGKQIIDLALEPLGVSQRVLIQG